MRRLLLFGLLAALLAAPAAARAASITTRIIQDCADDSVLEGHYSVAELRKALNHLPTDVAEYSDCSDVLTRAINAATAGSGSAPAAPPAQSATPAPGGTGTNTAPRATPTPAPREALDLPATGAATVQDKAAGGAAIRDARGQPVDVGGQAIRPGRLVAAIRPPTTLLVVLILLAACALAVGVPFLRRVLAHRRR
ncbi:MAG TPA: hypothetical protein VH418_12405 [Solirubrobacteraceae bacterium]|jgi:hypothetical protein